MKGRGSEPRPFFLAIWIFSRRCLPIELPHPARDKCRGHRENRPRGKNIEWLSRRPNVGWASRRALTRAWCHWSADHIRQIGREACREKVCQYVLILVDCVSIKNKQ